MYRFFDKICLLTVSEAGGGGIGGHPRMLTIVLFCLRRVSLFSPGGPRTCYVAQMVPELRDSPV